ncbi:MAG TPA: DNRLRE domain-containing protein, partial [Candidatus Poseidoniales archaeon]
DVTEAVQAALANSQNHVSLMVYTSSQTTDEIVFTSTQGSASEAPYMTLVWEDGTVATPTVSGVNTAPSTGTIVWDATSHALKADRAPTFAWTYSGTTSATDWRVFIQADASDDMAGLYTYDSRTTPSAFDITNLTFTPSSDLSFAQEIRWMVQPINNGMLGPRSASTIFYLPNDVGEEVNSTHATLSIQEGSIVPSLAYPATTQDTYLDTGTIYTNRGSSSSLFVGRSQVSTSNPNLRSMSLVNMNFSALPLPSTFEVVNASLEFNVVNTYQSTLVAVSEVNSAWSESSVYAYPAGNTSSWAQTGGFSLNDHDVPFNAPEWVNNTGSVAFNVTALVQHALSNNIAALDVLLFPVELDGGVDGRVQFASSESSNIDVRPRLNLTYRTTTSWTPTAPTNLLPADGSTLWDTSQPRPSGVNDSDFSWATSYSNETQFVVCGGDDPLFLTDDTTCYNSNDILAGLHDNITLDLANDTANNADMEKGDFWQYWRIRADQGDRIGEWSAVHKYRNPVDQGSDDGNGNHTLNISRGSIFEQTGLLPSVPDVEIDSNSTVNRGSSSSVVLGVNSLGTGESRILMEFDLSNMPWPSAMTPTQMMLRMYQPGVSGTSSTTIAAYACSSFTESSVVWATAPTCSTTEITRSTLTLNNPFGWMEWDLTSLAQSNIANGNTTMTFMLAMIGSTGSSHSFYSSEYSDADYHPHLVLDYVDNVNGIVPPGQPMLTSPADGQVLYAEDNGLLTPSTQPVLTWTPVSGATGYIVTVANSTGVYKFKSWEDSEITNTTFRFADNLSEGQLFSWWVQGVNQSIPGPSSARWSFAVGDPDHTYNNDYTYTYAIQTGNEIGAFGHTNIQDTGLYSEYPQTNFAGESTISAGDYCGTLWADECRINIGLNAAQIPFAQYQQVHSASLGLFVESWTSVQGATSVSFSVHPITNANWGAASATWNGTTAGGTWGAPGMQAGVDYGDAVSTTTANVDTTGWLWFDISTPGMTITSQQAWIIIATPNTGHAHASFYSGSTVNADYRPQILFNTTNISSVSISPTGTLTTDADTAVNFNSVAYDHLSMVQSPPMSWSSSTGNIGSNGLFTPTTTGLTTITSCFGLVCGTQSINVTAGAPTELIVTPLSATISADESLTITAHMVDQHGNMVPGEPITYTPTNGSMSAVVPNIFQPYAVGSHVVRVAHNVPSGEFVDVAVTVEAGAPSYFELGGCDGTVPAGVWCDITIDLYDQFGNALDLADAGNLTWSTTNGNYSEIDQKYFPDHVGVWWLNLTSVSGAMDELQITVGHGAIDYLELNASSTSITADDRVYINTTRVDVRGNRLAVVLPADNWTKTSDGQLTPGAPAIWDPVKTGSKILEARYETELTQMVIDVSRGQTQTLRITVEGEIATWQHFDITADDTLEAKIFAIDGKGNQWAVPESNWSLDHPTINDASNFIEVLTGDATTFTPYYASDLPYTLTASYSDVNTDLSVSINITVDHGMLNTVSIEGVANDPQRSTGALIEMTSDFAVDFTSELFDADNNRISSDELTWLEVNVATGDVQDITTQLLLDEMRWEATTVGEWRIDAYSISGTGFNISDSVSITVLHGEAVTVAAALSTTSPTAGDQVDIQVTGTDADGNQFAQDVEWTENGASVPTLSIITSSEGTYLYDAEVA